MIVWGTVRDIRLVDNPVVQSVRPDSWRWVDAPCETFKNGWAVEVDIQIEERVGGLTYTGETVTAHLGAFHRLSLDPQPVLDEVGTVIWQSAGGLQPVGEEPWKVGSKMGFPLHFVEQEGKYSLMGEPVFRSGGDGKLLFQTTKLPIDFGPPEGAGELTALELFSRIEECQEGPSSAAVRRRSRVVEQWGPHSNGTGDPSFYIAAFCPHPDAASEQAANEGDPEPEPDVEEPQQ